VTQRSVLSCSFESLTHVLQGSGRAKSIWAHLRNGQHPWEVALSKKQATLFYPAFTAFKEEISSCHQADCGTTKLTLKMTDALEVETVLIPMPGRTTLCLSSQVGCARACDFCSTGQMGLVRNLTAHEILFQVFAALKTLNAQPHLPPLRNIVFMGMGEPLNNWSEVEKSISQLINVHTFGFGPKHITLSTVGPSPQHILKLKKLPIRFAWSMHAAKDTTRKKLVPTTKNSIEALAQAFATLLRPTKERLFIEMTLIENVNDSVEDAHALVQCLQNLPNESRVNLIPVNPTPGNTYEPPSALQIAKYRSVVRQAGYFCSIRPSRGQTETAACGQLVTLRTHASP
jgi:23S rRNA (adenine2503-C2)-methyltransferase